MKKLSEIKIPIPGEEYSLDDGREVLCIKGYGCVECCLEKEPNCDNKDFFCSDIATGNDYNITFKWIKEVVTIQVFIKGKEYTWEQILDFSKENDFNIIENEKTVIGEQFIILKHNNKDIVISFILSSSSSNLYYYECVYTDLKLCTNT